MTGERQAGARRIGDFAGVWLLEREVEDRRAGQVARFEGRAELMPQGAGRWLWQESGLLRFGAAAPVRAERRYLWQEQGEAIAVLFDDGRFFHAFDPDQGAPVAAHFCDPDQYDARYDLANWPRWRVTWEVRGPRKDYRMVTDCRRDPAETRP